ncbi:hypothetical protein PV08_00148 [Exophiala spinifera]|uniref:N-acetyltransferase domain-containing protein n=1 Tax=Exophiala spinifera TaxID=91928 RepID=A0A0D2BLX7_9EURO|nr:uncharacterized protein PV08_00148 [Exophiala spinifera]KIW19575.1 hypothetical protein PV08_00148 [Exophiala spinifera]
MSSSSTSTQSQPYKVIPSDSQDDLDHFIDIISDSFAATALTTSFIVDNDKTPPPYPSPLVNKDRRRRHFASGILDSAASGAELVQAGNWSAVALWEPPHFQGKAFIDSKADPGTLLTEWRGRVSAAKARCLALPPSTELSPSTDSDSTSTSDSDGDKEAAPAPPEEQQLLRPYYHLSFLARNKSVSKVEGSINAVMTPFLNRARDENVAAWLEATTPQAARIYEHFGFRIVEKITIGKGKIDHEGWPSGDGQEGEGVTAWAMVYDQHLRD